MNKFNIFISDELAEKVMEVETPRRTDLGNGYSSIRYHIPNNLIKYFNTKYVWGISNIETPEGDLVFPEWTIANICEHTIDEQMGWIFLEYFNPGDIRYCNYVNVDGEFLFDEWMKSDRKRYDFYAFNKHLGFARIIYKGQRCKLYTDGTIERWSAATERNNSTMCTMKDYKAIESKYGDIASDLKFDKGNGIIKFRIYYDDIVEAGYPENSRLFVTQETHRGNKFDKFYGSSYVDIRISKPPRANGEYCLYIKKEISYMGIQIVPLKNIDEVINALDKRLMAKFNRKN